MSFWMRHNAQRFLRDADNGSNGGSNGDGDAAAKAAADKAAADKAAADKAAADKAAADAAAAGTKPSDTEAKLLKEVMEKKAELKKLSDQITAANAALKNFEGIDPVKVRELLDNQRKLEEDKLKASGDFDRLKAMMVESHQTETKTLKQQIEDLSGKLTGSQKLIQDLTVGSAFNGSPFIQENLVLTPQKARVVYGGHFEVEESEVVAYDKPRGAANRTKLVDARGNAVPFEDAIKRLVESDPDRERLTKSKLQPGAGSGSTPGKSAGSANANAEPVGRARISAALSARKKS